MRAVLYYLLNHTLKSLSANTEITKIGCILNNAPTAAVNVPVVCKEAGLCILLWICARCSL